MIINVATVKLLEDKLSDLVLCHQPDVEAEKVILLAWVLELLQAQYNEGFKEGFVTGEHEAEVQYEQSVWEIGYQAGIIDGRLDSTL